MTAGEMQAALAVHENDLSAHSNQWNAAAAQFAKADHTHPAQTSVSGNAGTATKLKTARKIGSASFDGSADITLADIGAAASGHTHTAANVGAVPTTRKVNGKALSADVTLAATDVGAVAAGNVAAIQVLTLAEYNALATKNATTLYLIKE